MGWRGDGRLTFFVGLGLGNLKKRPTLSCEANLIEIFFCFTSLFKKKNGCFKAFGLATEARPQSTTHVDYVSLHFQLFATKAALILHA